MKSENILILPGDGVGPEIMKEAIKIIDALNSSKICNIEYESADIGGIAIDNHNTPLPDDTLQKAKGSSSILLGAVGTKKHESNLNEMKPETGLLKIRKNLDLFINIRPVFLFDALLESSSLKKDYVTGVDIIIIRELVSDIYFGEPRGFSDDNTSAFNTMRYTKKEIERIATFAFELSQKRSSNLTSVDKANVLETSQLWRKVVSDIGEKYKSVKLNHMYVDNAAMQLVRNPKQFDVVVTGNMFGDILSDIAAMLTGSLGMLPSASLAGSGVGLFEPVHGTAPDIAGENVANPIATILSVAMMCKYSLDLPDCAEAIENAVNAVLDEGFRSADIASREESKKETILGCVEMGEKIISALAI